MKWEIYPDGLYDCLLRIHREYGPPRIFITENGAAFDDPADAGGRIADARRIAYLREHLRAAHRAVAQGVPLAGYFVWTLLDNFEWGFGYRMKFGLFAVDPETRQRLPKDSAAWYRDVAVASAVDDALTPLPQGESRAHEA
jgi:beta-glucosidase